MGRHAEQRAGPDTTAAEPLAWARNPERGYVTVLQDRPES
jgi:hypothetical protein